MICDIDIPAHAVDLLTAKQSRALMTSPNGFMIFLSDTPIVGIDPHPASAPNGSNKADPLAAWKERYAVFETEAEAQTCIDEDFESRKLEAEEDEEMEVGDEPDELVLPVHVHADGRLDVFDDAAATEPFVSHSPEQICEAYGMRLDVLLAKTE